MSGRKWNRSTYVCPLPVAGRVAAQADHDGLVVSDRGGLELVVVALVVDGVQVAAGLHTAARSPRVATFAAGESYLDLAEVFRLVERHILADNDLAG